MHKSRFADAKPGRTLDQLTTQLRSRCALIGQNLVKAEVQRAGDSPREVPSSTGLCKTHSHTHYHILPGVWYLCIAGLDCVGVKNTNWDFNSYSNEGKTTVTLRQRGQLVDGVAPRRHRLNELSLAGREVQRIRNCGEWV